MEDLNYLRYKKVAEGLVDQPIVKFFLSILSSGWAAFNDIVHIEPMLLAAVFVAIAIDYYTGIRASKKKKIPITSFGLRQLAPKVIEYGLVILLFTAGAYGFGRIEGDSWIIDILSQLKHAHYLAYFWCFYTESKSILENLGGESSRFQELWDIIQKKIFDDK